MLWLRVGLGDRLPWGQLAAPPAFPQGLGLRIDLGQSRGPSLAHASGDTLALRQGTATSGRRFDLPEAVSCPLLGSGQGQPLSVARAFVASLRTAEGLVSAHLAGTFQSSERWGRPTSGRMAWPSLAPKKQTFRVQGDARSCCASHSARPSRRTRRAGHGPRLFPRRIVHSHRQQCQKACVELISFVLKFGVLESLPG